MRVVGLTAAEMDAVRSGVEKRFSIIGVMPELIGHDGEYELAAFAWGRPHRVR